MDFDYKILEEKFKLASEEVQKILTSTKVTSDVKNIADKNGLLIDQSAILFDLVSYILLGLVPAKDFVRMLSKEANLPEITSKKVAQDINNTVLADIRGSMQSAVSNDESLEVQKTNDLNAISQAGGFTIEKEADQDLSYTNDSDVTKSDKARILNDVEFPSPSTERIVNNNDNYEDNHTEPLVDQLLTGTTSRVAKKVTINAPINLPIESAIGSDKPTYVPNVTSTATVTPPKSPETPPKPKGPDMYREPMK